MTATTRPGTPTFEFASTNVHIARPVPVVPVVSELTFAPNAVAMAAADVIVHFSAAPPVTASAPACLRTRPTTPTAADPEPDRWPDAGFDPGADVGAADEDPFFEEAAGVPADVGPVGAFDFVALPDDVQALSSIAAPIRPNSVSTAIRTRRRAGIIMTFPRFPERSRSLPSFGRNERTIPVVRLARP